MELKEESAKVPEITTSLFSFKTFRSPDKISQADKNQFFIHYPDLEQGLFNQNFLLNTDESSRSRSENFVRNLQAVRHYKEIRAMNIDFYDYSCLLMEQRRNDSSRPPFDEKTPRPLAQDVYLRVWEELFIQIVTQQSTVVRQTCVQLIMTQFYIENKE